MDFLHIFWIACFYFSHNLPNVSYIKSIDIWLVVCLCFVVYSLVIFCIEVKLYTIHKKKEKTESNGINKSFYGDLKENEVDVKHSTKFHWFKINDHAKIATRIDRVSYYLYPVAFFIFAVLYWLYHLSVSGRL